MNKYAAFVFGSVACLILALSANAAFADQINDQSNFDSNLEFAYYRVFEVGTANVLEEYVRNSDDSVKAGIDELRLLNIPHSELISKIIVLRSKLNEGKFEEAKSQYADIEKIAESIKNIRNAREKFHKIAKASYIIQDLAKEISSSDVNDIIQSEISKFNKSGFVKIDDSEIKQWSDEDINLSLNNWNWDEKKVRIEKLLGNVSESASILVKNPNNPQALNDFKDNVIKYAKEVSLFNAIVTKCDSKYDNAAKEYKSEVGKILEGLKKTVKDNGADLSASEEQLNIAKEKLDKAANQYNKANNELKNTEKNLSEADNQKKKAEDEYTSSDVQYQADKYDRDQKNTHLQALQSTGYNEKEEKYIAAKKELDTAEEKLKASTAVRNQKEEAKKKAEDNYQNLVKSLNLAKSKFESANDAFNVAKNNFNNIKANLESKRKNIEDSWDDYIHLDYVKHDSYGVIKNDASKVAAILRQIDKEIEACRQNTAANMNVQNYVISLLTKSRKLRTFSLKIDIINDTIDAKNNASKSSNSIIDNILASIDITIAAAYYSAKNDNSIDKSIANLDSSIEYAKKISDATTSKYIQGLCYYEKAFLGDMSAKVEAIKLFRDLTSGKTASNDANMPDYIRNSKYLLKLLESSQPFIDKADSATLKGDIVTAINLLESGLRIHQNDPALVRSLLDAYRRSKSNVIKLKKVYSQYAPVKTDENSSISNDLLVSRAMFLSHALDKAMATDYNQYQYMVESEFENELSTILNAIGKNTDGKSRMAAIALQYSMSFTKQNSTQEKLHDLSVQSENAVKTYRSKDISNMNGLEWNELLIKVYAANGRSVLVSTQNKNQESDQSKQNEKQKSVQLDKVLGLNAYMEANNLASTLPYNNGMIESFTGDSFLRILQNAGFELTSKSDSAVTEDEMLRQLKSIYSLYLVNFNEIEDADSQEDTNYSDYHSLAEKEFNELCDRKANFSFGFMFDSLKTLAMVRDNKAEDALKYLFTTFGAPDDNDPVKRVKKLKSMIPDYCEKNNISNFEKALMLYAFAESLHGVNMASELCDEPIIDAQSINRSELCKVIEDLYNEIVKLSNENSMEFLSVMATRGYDYYKDDKFILSVLDELHSSLDAQPERAVKIVKQALRVHPNSLGLWRNWIDSEKNLLSRIDKSKKQEYCVQLLNDLNSLAFSKKSERKYGPEMLRGIIYKEQRRINEAINCFDNASEASDANPKEKAIALSMSVQLESSPVPNESNED